MLRKLMRVLFAVVHRTAYAASLYADLPPFLAWLCDKSELLWHVASVEPIGFAALAVAVCTAFVVAWLVLKNQPPLL